MVRPSKIDPNCDRFPGHQAAGRSKIDSLLATPATANVPAVLAALGLLAAEGNPDEHDDDRQHKSGGGGDHAWSRALHEQGDDELTDEQEDCPHSVTFAPSSAPLVRNRRVRSPMRDSLSRGRAGVGPNIR